MSPVCQLAGNESASGPSLTVSSAKGRIPEVQLERILVNRFALITQFLVRSQAGTYSVAVSPCNYLGCGVLPVEVTVNPEAFTTLKVEVTTGIDYE